MEHRVQKLISQAGIASRRKAEDLIAQGKVKVNGITIKLGDKADPERDEILVEGKPISLQEPIHIALYKPVGVVSTTHDPFGRQTVVDLVPVKEKLFMIGRLDKDAEGLVVLTNDGDLANRVMHPRYEVTKTYEAFLDKPLAQIHEKTLKQGVLIEGRTVHCHSVEMLMVHLIKITIHEGRKHIVKRLFEELGYTVVGLKRVMIGKLSLGRLKPGQWRNLSKHELELLTSSLA